MKNVVIDFEKTLGQLFYLGEEEVFEYKDNKKTDKVIGYQYNLASSVQGDSVKVKVLGDKKEFKMMEQVELVGPECKIYASAKGNFANVHYSLSAYDMKKASSKVGV